MQAIKFPGSNRVIAENQPEYKPLPAFIDKEGNVVVCFKFDFWERLHLLFFGRVFLHTMTFGMPYQPLNPTLENPVQIHK
jgi:hypothetical protein